ncbi:MAG: UDP-N-acetylmuramate--L-alanine ligase [Parcubacteria group bacterium]|nr:UDP-N-acetylmuramate--L-alanine ligase [Parcubacteria group bacterium]
MNEHAQNSYFFTGIGGIGMSALAQMLVAEGNTVAGSDREESPVTEMLEKQSIKVCIGQKAENLPEELNLLVYSDAVPEDNPERTAAAERGIAQLSYFQVLGRVSSGKRTVAVSGTHGKTTTTGMLAKILHDAGADETAIIGSIVQDFGSNYLQGHSDLFVVEACEYRDHLLELSPEILVITNLEWDHTDYFPTLAALQSTFRKAIQCVPKNGFIITDPQNPNIQPLLEGAEATVIDYTQESSYALRLPGEFNKNNARAAAAAARAIMPNILESGIVDSLAGFHGTWRRFQFKGTALGGVEIYDDYAHHPTAVSETLHALREKQDEKIKAGGRIIAAFHPHLYSRTHDLLDAFSRAFIDADEVVIAPIYAARELDDGTVSSELLAERIRAEGVSARATDSLDDVEKILREIAKPNDTIITMGAGDIYKVADAFVGE